MDVNNATSAHKSRIKDHKKFTQSFSRARAMISLRFLTFKLFSSILLVTWIRSPQFSVEGSMKIFRSLANYRPKPEKFTKKFKGRGHVSGIVFAGCISHQHTSVASEGESAWRLHFYLRDFVNIRRRACVAQRRSESHASFSLAAEKKCLQHVNRYVQSEKLFCCVWIEKA